MNSGFLITGISGSFDLIDLFLLYLPPSSLNDSVRSSIDLAAWFSTVFKAILLIASCFS